MFNNVDCLTKEGELLCSELSGTCVTDTEGFYIVNTLSIIVGIAIFWYLKKVLTETQNLDFDQWKLRGTSELVDLSGNEYVLSQLIQCSNILHVKSIYSCNKQKNIQKIT